MLLTSDMKMNGVTILNSGYSFHMSRNENLFLDYQVINGGKVLMGNNITYTVTGIQNIMIKIFNGVIRKLK